MKNKTLILFFSITLLALYFCNPVFAKKSRASAREKACMSNLRVIQGSIEMYNMDHNEMIKHYASDTEELLIKGKYLKKYSKPDYECEYTSIGNLAENGILFCTYHGDTEHLIYSKYHEDYKNYENYEKIPQNATEAEFKSKLDIIRKKREIEIEARKRRNEYIYYIVVNIPSLIAIFIIINLFINKKSKKQ